MLRDVDALRAFCFCLDISIGESCLYMLGRFVLQDAMSLRLGDFRLIGEPDWLYCPIAKQSAHQSHWRDLALVSVFEIVLTACQSKNDEHHSSFAATWSRRLWGNHRRICPFEATTLVWILFGTKFGIVFWSSDTKSFTIALFWIGGRFFARVPQVRHMGLLVSWLSRFHLWACGFHLKDVYGSQTMVTSMLLWLVKRFWNGSFYKPFMTPKFRRWVIERIMVIWKGAMSS